MTESAPALFRSLFGCLQPPEGGSEGEPDRDSFALEPTGAIFRIFWLPFRDAFSMRLLRGLRERFLLDLAPFW